MALTTLAEYKAWANILNTDLDTPLAVHLAVADARVKTYCGRDFEQDAAYVECVSGNDSNSITIAESPINSVTSLLLVDGDGNTTHTYDASDYYIDAGAPGVIRLRPASGGYQHATGLGTGGLRNQWKPLATFPLGHGNVKFTGDVGYATIPQDLKWAVWILVASMMAARGRDPSIQAATIGQVSVTFDAAADVWTEVQAALRPWRAIL